MIKSGVYGIFDKKHGGVYYGSSNDVFRRWLSHKVLLRKNKHYNRYMQNCWNKYGESNFDWMFIEPVEDLNKLRDREQFWLDTSIRIGRTTKGIFNAVLNIPDTDLFNRKQGVYTEERRINLSKKMMGNKFAAGKRRARHSDESCKRQSMKARKNNPSLENFSIINSRSFDYTQIREIIKLYLDGQSGRALAKKFGVGLGSISSIIRQASNNSVNKLN